LATKQWRLVVTDLGASASPSEVTIEATNWMAALKAGRSELGESGGVPTGSSCAVAPDGQVTILDPVEQRRYVLSPESSNGFKQPASSQAAGTTGPAARPRTPEAPEAPAAGASAQPAHADPATAEGSAQPAQADSATAEGSAQPAHADPATAEGSPRGKRAPKKTMAYVESPLAAQKSPEAERTVPVGSDPSKPADSSTTEAESKTAESETTESKTAESKTAGNESAAAVQPAPPWQLLFSRDQEPSSDNPLRYRERTYVVPEDTSKEAAVAVLRARLRELQREFEGTGKGKFFNLAVFDHTWSERPKRPPIATLQWKDWRGEPSIDYPLERHQAKRASKPPSPARERSNTDENDQRLAHAFEACQDLLFLSTPPEGLDFVVKLLQELVPSEAMTGSLYDINANEFRFVTLIGPGSEPHRGEAVSGNVGLFAAASRQPGTALRVTDLDKDSRFRADAEARADVSPRDALYMALSHQGQMLGMLQLLNRQQGGPFTAEDADLVAYVGGQLSEYLYRARLGSSPP
jgi:chemotaxis protein histidine kinase CheA